MERSPASLRQRLPQSYRFVQHSPTARNDRSAGPGLKARLAQCSESQPGCSPRTGALWFSTRQSVESCEHGEKALLSPRVSVCVTELPCLHFFGVYMLQRCNKHNVMGGKAVLASDYHGKRKFKMQRNVRRSWWTRFCGNWKRDQATKWRTRSRIQTPYPSASPWRGWKIQSWNTTSLDEGFLFQPLSKRSGYTANRLTDVNRSDTDSRWLHL